MTIEVRHTPTKTIVVPGNITAMDEKGIVQVNAKPTINDKEHGAEWEIWFGGTIPIKTVWYHVEIMKEIVKQLAESRYRDV